MNFIQEVLNLLERKQDKKTLDLNRDWFEFGRTKPSSVGNPLYAPKMTPHAIRYNDLKCNIISGLVQGTGTEHTLPMWSTVDPANCGVQTMIDSIFSQDAGATEGKVSGDFRVTGNTVLEGDLLVLGTQTIVESTIVQVADNIMRINSGGAALDAGIEVIQPSGTKTWAWDNSDGVWSTFGDSITTQDIKVLGAIEQDGEYLVNVVNEAEGLLSQDNDNSLATVAAIIDYVDTTVGNTTDVNKAEYQVIYTADVGLTQAGPGQLIFNQGTDEIYMSFYDFDNNDRKYALDTILNSPGKKPFGLFIADKNNPWVNYNTQYFNPCGIEILGINCLPWDGTTPNLNPTQGTTGDDGGAGIPIDIVWSSSSAGIKQGGQGAVYATVYVHPDVIAETIQAPVMSGSGLSFTNESIDDPKALATAFNNSGYVTLNPSITNPFTIYLNSSMTTIAGGGYYMERSEFDNLPSGSFGYISNWDDALQSWNKDIVSFKNPAATPATGDPQLICTVDSRSLEVSASGTDQFVIPWIEAQQIGTGWAPQNEQAIVTLDMAGKETCYIDANGNEGFNETVTDVAYNEDQNILGHVDEEGVISLMPLRGNSYIVNPGVSPGGGVFGTIETIENGTPVHTFKVVPGNEWIKIDSDGTELTISHKDSVTIPVTSISQNVDNGDTITSYKYAFDAAGHVTSVEQIASVLDITFPATSIDYLDSVSLVDTNLIFTGAGNAFNGTIDLSDLLDNTNLSRIVSGAMSGTDLILTRDDASTISIDLSSLSGGTTPIMSATITGTGKLWDDTVQVEDAAPVTAVTQRTYGVQFNDAQQLVVNVPWENTVGSLVVGNPGSPTQDLTSISIDGVVYGIAPSGSADGNDFISSVQLTGTDLVFTGTGGAFSGSVDLSSFLDDVDAQTLSLSGTDLTISNGNTVDLSSLAGVSYTAGQGLTLAGTEFSMTDVTRTNSSTAESPAHTGTFTVIDDITTNTKGQVTNVNVKTITLPASGTGADGVITDVSLSGTDLRFTGSNGGFNGIVDLSGLSDGNATYTLGLVASGANDTVVKLTGANGGADSQFTLAGGAGITVTENTSTNTIVIASTVTDTNDIDYVREVVLNGDSLDFTGIGNAFAGSIDLSAYANVPETLTRLILNANILTYRDEAGVDTNIDLSLYLDDTNLARLVSGTLDNATGIATFTRDDASTFTVDFSALFDNVDTTYSFDVPNNPSVAAISLQGSDGSTNTFKILPGNDIAISTSGGDIRIDSTASGATYTAGTGLTLNGSTFDANVNPIVQIEVSSPVTAVKGRVYDVQVNGDDQLVVNVPWIDTQYSAGTYLSLSGSQFNHDNTTRTNTTSAASPAAGSTFTAIDSVTTNATGHVTGINTKTITLPEGGVSSSTCVAGMWYASDQTGNQSLTSTFSAIGNPTLGFQNTDSKRKHYAITWTIQYASGGSSGVRFFETQMVQEVGGVPIVVPESKWADSGYMVSEYSTTRTYTLYTNMNPGDIIYPQVKGSLDAFIKKAHIQVVETECESATNGSITVIQGRT